MKTEEFRIWLQEIPLNPNPTKDCISRCRKVEKSLLVDLDDEFARDYGKTLMSNLRYTSEDEREHKTIPDGFNFKPGVNVRYRLTDMRSAVKKYFTFCQTKSSDND